MTTPTPPDPPGGADPAAPPAVPPPALPPPAPPAASAPVVYPFAPTVREPWINPSKRRTAGWIGAGAAVVLLGAGFAIGAASFGGGGHSGDRRGEMSRGDIHVYPGQLGPGRFGRPAGGPGGLPGQPTIATPTLVPTPTSSPS